MPADEFEIIRALFAPLATSAGARGLIDDVAMLETRGALVVTTDAIVEGVHFLPADPLDMVAKKALRVNFSDLAAKGATPFAALLTLVWPDARPSAEIAAFARGLGEDLALYGACLLGGDTTSTPGPLMVSITAFGEPAGSRVPSRADARPGDDVWVTGPIGDAMLGLQALRSGADDASALALIARYRLPHPRVEWVSLIAAHARASMDISDGLIADARKLARASGVALRIEAGRVPISAPARVWMGRHGTALTALLSGGDDYEILFTAEPDARAALEQAGAHRIGGVGAGDGVALIGPDGAPIVVSIDGFVHKLGR